MIRSLFSGDKPVVLAILLAVVVAVTLLQILIMPPDAEGTSFVSTGATESGQVRQPRPAGKRSPGAPIAPAVPSRDAGSVAITSTSITAPAGGGAEPAGATRAAARPDGPESRPAPAPEGATPPDPREARPAPLAAEDINPTGAGVVPVMREERNAGSVPAASQLPIQPRTFVSPAAGAPAGDPAAEPIPPAGAAPAAPAVAPGTEEPPLQTDVTPDLDAGGTQLVVLGPSAASPGDTVTYLISTENASNVSHAPLQIVYDPEILEFVEAREGSLMSAGGASTFFMASASSAPGLIHVALSRMPPAGGIDGSGVLCSLTFKAKKAGESPIITAGSRLLDQSAHPVDLRRNDSYVAVR